MVLEDLNRYYTQLVEHLDKNLLFSISNSDRAHNSTVMRFMFDKCPDINMFCGEMSVFRSNFYNHINNLNNNDLGTQLKEQLAKSIREFMSTPNRKLRIIIANYERRQFYDLISEQAFKEGLTKGNVEFYSLDGRYILKDSLKHCTYSDVGVVRLEEDQESHQGICSIHIGDELKAMLQFNFNIMLNASERILYPFN